jgi:hypothetical protein
MIPNLPCRTRRRCHCLAARATAFANLQLQQNERFFTLERLNNSCLVTLGLTNALDVMQLQRIVRLVV